MLQQPTQKVAISLKMSIGHNTIFLFIYHPHICSMYKRNNLHLWTGLRPNVERMGMVDCSSSLPPPYSPGELLLSLEGVSGADITPKGLAFFPQCSTSRHIFISLLGTLGNINCNELFYSMNKTVRYIVYQI